MAIVFYASGIAVAAVALFAISVTRLQSIHWLATLARTCLVIVTLLPIADYVFERTHRQQRSPEPVVPLYSFAAAKGQPAAFNAWWAYYTAEWLRPNGGAASIYIPDPRGTLPKIHKPNSTASFFEATIRINNFGFRGPDIELDKGNRYRVFALGESPTFGATIRKNDRAWPEVLETLISSRLRCARPVEIVNAGTGGYNLQDNVERLKRDILPLQPDLVVSYHGFNGAQLVDGAAAATEPVPEPRRPEGPSPLINEAMYRYRLSRWRNAPTSSPILSDISIMTSRHAELYRQLLKLGQEHHVLVALATFSMAITPSSPREVTAFYARAFPTIADISIRMAAHNRIVEQLAEEYQAPLIDTTPTLNGKWDDDLYLDPIHLTQKGSDRLAEAMYIGLLPILRASDGPRCLER